LLASYAQENTLKLVPVNDVLYRLSGEPAGPLVTAPVVENVDPWFEQKNLLFPACHTTGVPWCVHACATAR
jgi:hypothetical protein